MTKIIVTVTDNENPECEPATYEALVETGLSPETQEMIVRGILFAHSWADSAGIDYTWSYDG